MIVDTDYLSKELQAAGIQNAGCNSNGVVWGTDGITEIQSRPDVAAIIAAHNYQARQEQRTKIENRQINSASEANLASQLRTLTPQQAVDYIETNVTNLASAKTVMKIMVRMLIALRDAQFPELPEG